MVLKINIYILFIYAKAKISFLEVFKNMFVSIVFLHNH